MFFQAIERSLRQEAPYEEMWKNALGEKETMIGGAAKVTTMLKTVSDVDIAQQKFFKERQSLPPLTPEEKKLILEWEATQPLAEDVPAPPAPKMR